jgi:phage shock protein A
MSIWNKLVTALRGGANEVGEAIVDGQALRILDQEIRDADRSIAEANRELVVIMGKHKLASQRVAEFNANIADWEKKALAADAKGESALALECAEVVARLTDERDAEQKSANEFAKAVEKLRATVSKTETQIKGLRQQTDLARARESVQKAQANASLATGGANGKLETAVSSLNRLKERQNQREAEFEAAEQLAASRTGSDLENRLKAAGIGDSTGSAADVLARLKAQRDGQQGQ